MTDNDRLNLLLNLHRYAEAEKLAREAIARDPQWASGYTHLARALVSLNRKDEAIAAAREGVRKAPTDSWAHATLGCVLNWFGDARGALEPAQEAVRLDPRYPWAAAMLANVLFNLDRFRESLDAALEGLKHDPLSETLIRWKGWAEHKLGRSADALKTADEGLKHHPNSHLLVNLIGCIEWTEAEKRWGPVRVRGHRSADARIREAVRLDPGQPAYRDNLRGNAVSCRRHVLDIALPVLALLLVVIPVALIGLTAVRHRAEVRMFWVVLSGVPIFLVACIWKPGPRAAVVAPLGWLGVPGVPPTEADRYEGRREWGAYIGVWAIPWGVAIGALWG
jgi:tetratricopeptide (TPR) repeat protein